MDQYGRLPSDINELIGKLYHLPIIDISDSGHRNINLIIKYPHFEFNLYLKPPLTSIYFEETKTYMIMCHNDALYKIECVIITLKENSTGFVYNHIDFYIDNNIVISNGYIKLMLNLSCKPDLIKAFEKYYKILSSYPQIY